MQLPNKISPNPLIISTIEIRFESALSSNSFLGIAVTALSSKLPNIEQNSIPKTVKESNPNFKYIANFAMSNDKYKVSFSDGSISFENIAEYPLWPNYLKFIKDTLLVIMPKLEIKKIERIGVRYGSVFDNTSSAKDVMTNVPEFVTEKYYGKLEHFIFQIEKEENKLLLQVFDNAQAIKNQKQLQGVYIDIDASCVELKDTNSEYIIKKIDVLHSEQKELFFSLLKPTFLATLNPQY